MKKDILGHIVWSEGVYHWRDLTQYWQKPPPVGRTENMEIRMICGRLYSSLPAPEFHVNRRNPNDTTCLSCRVILFYDQDEIKL